MALLTRILPVAVFRQPGDGRSILATSTESEVEPEAKRPDALPTPETPTLERKVKQGRPMGQKPTPNPKKGGRPRHVATTVRDVKTSISFSREEASLLTALAQDSGYGFSEWIRRVLFDVAKVAARPHPEKGMATGSIDTRNKPYLEPAPAPVLPDRAYDKAQKRVRGQID